MSIIQVQEMTPEIYTAESRDFQLLSRLYDSVFNGLKFDTDSIVSLINTKECRTNILQLLQTKLGFFTERKIDDEKLRSILECFPVLVRNKGSLRAIKEALYLFLRMYSVSSDLEIYYLKTPFSPPFSQDEPCVLPNGKFPENDSLIIRIHSFQTKPEVTVLEELFRYILPAGINYYIEFDKKGKLQDIILTSEDSAELLFVSDNLNSEIRNSGQIFTTDDPNSETSKIAYKLGAVNTESLISTDSYVSNRFIGYYTSEEDANDYLETLADKLYSTAIINYDPIETKTGSIVSFLPDPSVTELEDLTVAVNSVQSGSGDPSPENVRPITGWTGATVYDDPAYGGFINWNQLIKNGNFADGKSDWISGGSVTSFTVSDGVATLEIPATSGSGTKRIGQSFTGVSGHKYYVKYETKVSVADKQIVAYAGSGGSIIPNVRVTPAINTWTTAEAIVTSGGGSGTIVFGNTTAGDSPYTLQFRNIIVCNLTVMFGAGNEPTTVEAFKALFYKDYYTYNVGTQTCVSAVNGDPYLSIPVTFSDPPGTVYGGTLDLVSGVLTVTSVRVALDTFDWQYQSSGTRFRADDIASTAKLPPTNNDVVPGFICDTYKTVAGAETATINNSIGILISGNVCIKDTRYTTKAQLAAALSGVYLVYPLATPLTYQLTPQEISALVGQNNIWADTGDVTVTYKRDFTCVPMICISYSNSTPTWKEINFLGNLTTEEVATEGGIVAALEAKGITVTDGDLILYNNLYLLRINGSWQECNYARYILNTYNIEE